MKYERKLQTSKDLSKLPNKTEYRAVIVENQKIGLRQMADNIEQNMSLMSADLVAAEAALRDEIVYNLMSGNSVHLPGIWSLFTIGEGQCVRRPSYASPSATQC